MKKCSICGIDYTVDNFYQRNEESYRNDCKKCVKSRVNKYRNKNLQLIKTKKQKYCQDNKEKIAIKRRQKYERNKQKERNQQKQYYELNKQEKWFIPSYDRYKKDPEFKIKVILRNRLRRLVKNNQKSGSPVRDLGCSIEELRQHLESQFKEGMSWENYGQYGWHIDHIIPLSSFDLTDREQFHRACHYTNLQPLWAKENLSKGSKF